VRATESGLPARADLPVASRIVCGVNRRGRNSNSDLVSSQFIITNPCGHGLVPVSGGAVSFRQPPKS